LSVFFFEKEGRRKKEEEEEEERRSTSSVTLVLSFNNNLFLNIETSPMGLTKPKGHCTLLRRWGKKGPPKKGGSREGGNLK